MSPLTGRVPARSGWGRGGRTPRGSCADGEDTGEGTAPSTVPTRYTSFIFDIQDPCVSSVTTLYPPNYSEQTPFQKFFRDALRTVRRCTESIYVLKTVAFRCPVWYREKQRKREGPLGFVSRGTVFIRCLFLAGETGTGCEGLRYQRRPEPEELSPVLSPPGRTGAAEEVTLFPGVEFRAKTWKSGFERSGGGGLLCEQQQR